MSMRALLMLGIVAGSFGCAGGNGAETKSVSGTSSLTVIVRAEPKTGWRSPPQSDPYTDRAEPAKSAAYTTLNYSSLDEIVVWVETATPVPIQPPPVSIDIASPPKTPLVAAAGAVWQIRNTSTAPQTLFIRTEEGQVTNLGRIDAGGLIDVAPQFTGGMELLADSRESPIVRVFVAPSPAARVTRAGQAITFQNLPPGPATVSCWHPRLPGSSAPVQLQPGRNSRVTLLVTVNQLPKVTE